MRHAKDLFPATTTSSRYAHNLMVNQREIDVAAARDRILPTPKSVSYQKGRTEISQSWQIQFQGRLKNEVNYLQQQLAYCRFSVGAKRQCCRAICDKVLF
ncbi:MAG: hypothetical protein U5L01_11130 [Rheinheimera sp.]|nr:hypothetical protein [Rheinheimera sp.]